MARYTTVGDVAQIYKSHAVQHFMVAAWNMGYEVMIVKPNNKKWSDKQQAKTFEKMQEIDAELYYAGK